MPSAVLSQAIAAWYDAKRSGRSVNPMDVIMRTAVKPTSFINCKDPSARSRVMAANLIADGHFLEVAHHADHNWSNTNGANQSQFSIAFSHNGQVRQDGINGLERTWVSKSDTSAVYAIRSGGSNGEALYIRVFLPQNAAGTVAAEVKIPVTWVWTDCVFTFDGTQSGDLAKVRCYVDGRLIDPATYVITFSGGATAILPAVLNGTSTIKFGKWSAAFPALASDAIWNVRLFKGRVLTGDATGGLEAGALWANGNGVRHDRLANAISLTGLVGSYDCSEGPGTRADLSGLNHPAVESGGAVGTMELVQSIADVAGLTDGYRAHHPIRYGEWGLGSAPSMGSINGQPALSYAFNHSLRAGIDQALNTPTMTLVQACRFRSLVLSEQFLWTSAREADDNAYLFHGPRDSSGFKMWMRVRDTNAGGAPGDNHWLGSLAVAVDTSYITWWRLKATGDALSAEHRLNGVDGVLTPGSGLVHNKGPQDVRGRQNVTLGSLVRNPATSPTSTALLDALIGSTLVFGPGIPRDEALMLEAWLANEYAIAI